MITPSSLILISIIYKLVFIFFVTFLIFTLYVVYSKLKRGKEDMVFDLIIKNQKNIQDDILNDLVAKELQQRAFTRLTRQFEALTKHLNLEVRMTAGDPTSNTPAKYSVLSTSTPKKKTNAKRK